MLVFDWTLHFLNRRQDYQHFQPVSCQNNIPVSWSAEHFNWQGCCVPNNMSPYYIHHPFSLKLVERQYLHYHYELSTSYCTCNHNFVSNSRSGLGGSTTHSLQRAWVCLSQLASIATTCCSTSHITSNISRCSNHPSYMLLPQCFRHTTRNIWSLRYPTCSSQLCCFWCFTDSTRGRQMQGRWQWNPSGLSEGPYQMPEKMWMWNPKISLSTISVCCIARDRLGIWRPLYCGHLFFG